MTVANAKKYAKRARSQRTVEEKLNDIASAIEEMADAMDGIDNAIDRIDHIDKMIRRP